VSPDVTVMVPPTAESIRVLRAVAAAFGARLDFTYDRIEDLKLGVSEACATLLSLPGRASIMVLRLVSDDKRVTALVCTDADPGEPGWPPSQVESTLAWQVLSGLADEAVFELSEDGPAVRIMLEGGSR
jgi:anti-sigma regulatory factor (Ser/Thr protein kinase)